MLTNAYSSETSGLRRRMRPLAVAALSVVVIISTYSCKGSGESGNQNSASTADESRAPKRAPAACDNQYYPAETGSVRNYKITNRGTALPSLTYSEQRTNVTFGSFSDHRDFSDGVKSDAQWTCTADGLVSSEFSIPVVMRLSTAYKFDSFRASGPAMPATDKWTPGYQWTTTYDVTGTENPLGSQSPGKVTGTIEVKSEIRPSEKVTVAAGSYDCVLVDSTIRHTLRIESSQGSSRPALSSARVSAWYAKGVGLVRAAFSGDIGTGEEELTSISR